MTQPVLHYIFDPLCGWCHGASSLVEAAARAGARVELHPGLLFAQARELPAAQRASFRQADERIRTLTGARFGDAYFARLQNPAPMRFHSLPPAAAVMLAAGRSQQDGLALLALVQAAHYEHGRDVSDVATLAALAATLGFDEAGFATALQAPETLARVQAAAVGAHRLMGELGGNGLPTLGLDRGTGTRRMAHERWYGQPEAFAAQVNAAASPA
ncbi:MAG: DsbA family protein [Burkholderiales bacterium]